MIGGLRLFALKKLRFFGDKMKLNYSKKRSIFGTKIIAKEAEKKYFPKKGKVYYHIYKKRGVKIGYLDTVKVGLFSRKKGIGTKLVKKSVQEMKSKGVKKIRVSIFSLQSEAMLKILEKEGFKQVNDTRVGTLRLPTYELKL